MDYGLWIMDYGLVLGLGLGLWIRVMDYGLGLWIMDYGF